MYVPELVANIEGTGGYVTLYGKHGGRTNRVGRRTRDALQVPRCRQGARLADHRVHLRTPRQSLTAAAQAAEEDALAALLCQRAHCSRAVAAGLSKHRLQ